MTDPIHEQLSAFHDGELPAAESELLLKRLQRDPQLRTTVGRYSLIGEALRSTEAGGPSKDFAARVAQALEQEEVPKPWRPVADWLKPVAGGAIAAGVAAVALVSLRMTQPDTSPAQVAAEAADQSAPVVQVVSDQSVAKPDSYTVPMNTMNREAPPIQVINNGRLANFVMAHSEYSSPLNQRNVLTGLLIEEPMPESNDSQSASPEPATR
jgi:sigma-E factor negative regulatory protein RseA